MAIYTDTDTGESSHEPSREQLLTKYDYWKSIQTGFQDTGIAIAKAIQDTYPPSQDNFYRLLSASEDLIKIAKGSDPLSESINQDAVNDLRSFKIRLIEFSSPDIDAEPALFLTYIQPSLPMTEDTKSHASEKTGIVILFRDATEMYLQYLSGRELREFEIANTTTICGDFSYTISQAQIGEKMKRLYYGGFSLQAKKPIPPS